MSQSVPLRIPETTGLPALVTRAGQRLLDAKSSAEVLEAKHFAEAALHYAKVTSAANETHADCLRIITRAEMRMADEIDAGQKRGEIATSGQHGGAVQTSDSLDLDRRRVAEWRETRDAGPEIVEQAIQGALSEGRAPTKADIRAHVRGTFGTGENEWYTPALYLDTVRDFFGGTIPLDAASNDKAQDTVRADRYFSLENDALTQPWWGNVWLNPPYAQPAISHFVSKLVAEVSCGNVAEAVLLTHNYTDTGWFHEAISAASAICFTRGRIRFYDSAGKEAAPTQGQAFHYFGPRVAEFHQHFAPHGFIVEVRH